MTDGLVVNVGVTPDITDRAATRLSTPPPSPPASVTDMTPRTAARVTDVASKAKKINSHPAKRIKVLGADEEIELHGSRMGARERDLSGILGKVCHVFVHADIQGTLHPIKPGYHSIARGARESTGSLPTKYHL